MQMILPLEDSGSPMSDSSTNAVPVNEAAGKEECLPLEALAHLVRQDTACQILQAFLDKAVEEDMAKAMRRAAEYLTATGNSAPTWEVPSQRWEDLSRTVKVKWLKCGFHRIGGRAAAEARRQAGFLLREHERLLTQLHRTEKQARARMDRLLTVLWERVPVSSAALNMLRLQHRIATSNRLYREGQRHTGTCIRQLDAVEEACAALCSRAARQGIFSFAIVPTVGTRHVSLRCDEELH